MNKKGTSILELIISIALISLTLLFLVRLIVDINNKETNSSYTKENSINRAEIIRAIESDITNKELQEIKDLSTDGTLVFSFIFSDKTKSLLSSTKDTLNYTNSSGKKRKWTIKGGTIYTDKASCIISKDNKNAEKKFYTLVINIEINNKNEKNTHENNNPIDDITINYLGNSNIFQSNITCLGYKC